MYTHRHRYIHISKINNFFTFYLLSRRPKQKHAQRVYILRTYIICRKESFPYFNKERHFTFAARSHTCVYLHPLYIFQHTHTHTTPQYIYHTLSSNSILVWSHQVNYILIYEGPLPGRISRWVLWAHRYRTPSFSLRAAAINAAYDFYDGRVVLYGAVYKQRERQAGARSSGVKIALNYRGERSRVL